MRLVLPVKVSCLIVLLLAQSIPAALAQQPMVYRGICDASAAVALGQNHFVVADDEADVLTIYRRGIAESVGRVDLTQYLGGRKPNGKAKETDIEGAARIGNRIYWIASHSRDGKGRIAPERFRLFATDVIETGAVPGVRASASAPYAGLLSAIVADKRFDILAQASQFAAEDPRGLNIEGLAASPDGGLVIGFRNPRRAGMALTLKLRNPADVLERGSAPEFDDLVALDLGGRGIRSMEHMGNGYAILAGPFDDGKGGPDDFALYTWSGKTASAPAPVADVSLGTLHPEALFKVPGLDQLIILSDDGGELVDGAKCKKKSVPGRKKGFREIGIRVPAALARP